MKRVRDLPKLVVRSTAVVWKSARRAFIGTIILNTFNGALLLAELVVLKVVLGRFVDVGGDAPVRRLVVPVAIFVAGLAIGGVVAQLTGVHVFALGSSVTLYLDPAQVHVFDPAGDLLVAPSSGMN